MSEENNNDGNNAGGVSINPEAPTFVPASLPPPVSPKATKSEDVPVDVTELTQDKDKTPSPSMLFLSAPCGKQFSGFILIKSQGSQSNT